LVRTAFRAAALRLAALRFRALARACRLRDRRDAALCPSRLRAPRVALERRADVLCRPALRPLAVSRSACFRARAEALPFFGALSFTPALRASDSPIAIACFVERAPCFPLRM